MPSHRHEGFEIVLHPLKGEAEAVLDGEQVALRAGEMIFVDGANDFAPANKGRREFLDAHHAGAALTSRTAWLVRIDGKYQ